MTKSKRITLFALILLIVWATSIAGTWAYLNHTNENNKNTFGFGEVKIEVTGTNWNKDNQGTTNIKFDVLTPRNPQISNAKDSVLCYVRAKVIITNKAGTANTQNIMQFVTMGGLQKGWRVAIMPENTGKDWGKADSIVLVYEKPLAPGESTLPIFNEFTLHKESKTVPGVMFQGGTDNPFDIQIVAEAVQAEVTRDPSVKLKIPEDYFKELLDK